MPRTSTRLTRIRPNPTTKPTPTGSARTIEPQAMAKAGTMNVAVLAAVGVVCRRTRKKMAGERRREDAYVSMETAPSRVRPWGAREQGDRQRDECAGGHHPGRDLERLDVGEACPGEAAGDRVPSGAPRPAVTASSVVALG
jgi:hypothetical protein